MQLLLGNKNQMANFVSHSLGGLECSNLVVMSDVMQPSGVKTLMLALNKINKNVQPCYLKAILRTEARDEYSLRPTLSLF